MMATKYSARAAKNLGKEATTEGRLENKYSSKYSAILHARTTSSPAHVNAG